MEEEELPTFGKFVALQRIAQHCIDKTTLWIKCRWALFIVLVGVYAVRVYVKQGFYVVTYGLGIYLLNLLIGFMSPAIDPDMDGPVLPTTDREEFRPFSRKLPEFKFWIAAFRAVIASICMTFFEMFDLPVFWPILLAYFILLFMLTMKDRVRHMLKHKYVPISFGKKKYGDPTKDEPVAANRNCNLLDSLDNILDD